MWLCSAGKTVELSSGVTSITTHLISRKVVETTIFLLTDKLNETKTYLKHRNEHLSPPETTVSYHWDDIIGLDTVKEAIYDALILPLEYPEVFKTQLMQQTNAILLYGPPGTGKTMLAECITQKASEITKSQWNFIKASASSILSKWTGESERSVAKLFTNASRRSPCVLFLDEIDALALSRGKDTDHASRKVLTELLIQMNAMGKGVYVVAATNRVQDIDEALIRRFTRKIEVPLPNQEGRLRMLWGFVKDLEVQMEPEEMEDIATRTDHWSGSDLKQLTYETALLPLKKSILRSVGPIDPITVEHFIKSLEMVKASHFY